MKKQVYMTPSTEVLKIRLHNIMAASGPDKVYSDAADGIDNESNVLSRHGNIWDDED